MILIVQFIDLVCISEIHLPLSDWIPRSSPFPKLLSGHLPCLPWAGWPHMDWDLERGEMYEHAAQPPRQRLKSFSLWVIQLTTAVLAIRYTLTDAQEVTDDSMASGKWKLYCDGWIYFGNTSCLWKVFCSQGSHPISITFHLQDYSLLQIFQYKFWYIFLEAFSVLLDEPLSIKSSCWCLCYCYKMRQLVTDSSFVTISIFDALQRQHR